LVSRIQDPDSSTGYLQPVTSDVDLRVVEQIAHSSCNFVESDAQFGTGSGFKAEQKSSALEDPLTALLGDQASVGS